jgi:hypothetical protein
MGELLNVVGLSVGVVLYAMLLMMVLRGGRKSLVSGPFDPLLLGTAVLGLIWNLCALPAYELPKVGIAGPFPNLTALGFSALGFLPAVVVHSVLRGKRGGMPGATRRTLASIAYGVSGTAAALHFQSAWSAQPVPSVVGMRLLTYTFVALVIPLAAATRGQPGARRALWAAALATFAVSALHLSQLHQGGSNCSATTRHCRWPSPSCTKTIHSPWRICFSSALWRCSPCSRSPFRSRCCSGSTPDPSRNWIRGR